MHAILLAAARKGTALSKRKFLSNPPRLGLQVALSHSALVWKCYASQASAFECSSGHAVQYRYARVKRKGVWPSGGACRPGAQPRGRKVLNAQCVRQ